MEAEHRSGKAKLFGRYDRMIDLTGSLALQLQFFEVGFARVGLMSPAPGRPCEDVGARDAPLGKLHGDAPDFLDRPANQERCFGRGRGRVFLSTGAALAR